MVYLHRLISVDLQCTCLSLVFSKTTIITVTRSVTSCIVCCIYSSCICLYVLRVLYDLSCYNLSCHNFISIHIFCIICIVTCFRFVAVCIIKQKRFAACFDFDVKIN